MLENLLNFSYIISTTELKAMKRASRRFGFSERRWWVRIFIEGMLNPSWSYSPNRFFLVRFIGIPLESGKGIRFLPCTCERGICRI